jgi:DNA-binding MarR family transcriptional regulator
MDEALKDFYDLDRLIHEPARLMLMALLYNAESADFLYLLQETGLTKGNLSSHLSKLEDAEYIKIDKAFVGKIPRTTCRLTEEGRRAFDQYRKKLRQGLSAIHK